MKLQPKNFFSVIAVFHGIGKIYGLAPYSLQILLKKRQPTHLNTSINAAIFACKFKTTAKPKTKPNLAGVSTSAIYSYASTYEERVRGKPNERVIYELIRGLKVFTFVVLTSRLLTKRARFAKACWKMHEVDLQVKVLKKAPPNYAGFYWSALIGVAMPAFHLFYVGVKLVGKRDFQRGVVDFLTDRLEQDANLFVTFYYFFYVTVLYRRFVFVNETIFDLVGATKKRESLRVLRVVARMHENLCKGARYFNEVFSVPIFFIIICQLLEFLLLLYMTYRGEQLIIEKAIGYVLQLVNLLAPAKLATEEEKLIPVNMAEVQLCYQDGDMSAAVSF